MRVKLADRGRLLALATGSLLVALVAMLATDVPSLAIGSFLFVPVALVGLATSPLVGAVAGVVAGELYALGVVVGPELANDDLVTASSGLLLLSYATLGALVGKFSADHRDLASHLRTLADLDPLTGLLNHRAYEAELGRRVSAAAAFGLVLVDLDELKALNDTQGHAAGDATLSRLATVLAGAIRRDDVAARVGGDEFAVLVDGAGTIEAALAVERLDAALTTAGLSASVGWAAYPEDGDSAAAVRERADRRLYEQKARRRARGEDPSAAAGPKAAAEPLV